MKNIIRLIFFTITVFVVVFACSVALCFLQRWINAAAAMPPDRFITLKDVILSAHWTVSLSFYITLLLATSYSLRNSMNRFAAFIVISALAIGLCFSASKGLDMAARVQMPPFHVKDAKLGQPGLMLRRGETVIILIDDPSNPDSGRVTSVPGKPLQYEKSSRDARGNVQALPPVPFSRTIAPFFTGIFTDFSRSANILFLRLEKGILPFLYWLVPLAALLISLSYIFALGSWSLANLFLSVCVFRATLIFENFLNAAHTQKYLYEFFKLAEGKHTLLQANMLGPAILSALSALLLLYLFLVFIATRKFRKEMQTATNGGAHKK